MVAQYVGRRDEDPKVPGSNFLLTHIFFFLYLDEEISMLITRDTASSIMISQSTLWITGGKHFVEGTFLT